MRAFVLTWLTTPLWLLFWFVLTVVTEGANISQAGTGVLMLYVGAIAAGITLCGAGAAILLGAAPLYLVARKAGRVTLPLALACGAVLGALAFGLLPSMIVPTATQAAWQFAAGAALGLLHALIFWRLLTGRWFSAWRG